MDKVTSLAFEDELKPMTKTIVIKKDLNKLNIIPPKFFSTVRLKS